MLRNSADTLEEVPALLVRLGPGFPLGFWGEWKGRVVDVFFFPNEIFGKKRGGWGLEFGVDGFFYLLKAKHNLKGYL